MPDRRIIVPMPSELLEAVDDYRYRERVPSRADAIRRLLRVGLEGVWRPIRVNSECGDRPFAEETGASDDGRD